MVDPLSVSVVCSAVAFVAFGLDAPRIGWPFVSAAWGFAAWAYLG